MNAARARGTAAVAIATAALVCFAVLLSAFAPPLTADAYWTTSAATGSAGTAGTTTVNQGATPSATVQNRNNVVVGWSAGTMSNGLAATGYTVSRLDQSDAPQTVTSACAGTLTALTCTETGLPDGLWTYTVTPMYRNWLGTASAKSVVVRTDTTAPVNDITLTSVLGGASKTGNTIYFRNAAAGSFALSNALTDAGGSGPASSATSAFSGLSGGWTHTPSTVSTPVGGPFVSNTFSWVTSTIATPTFTVTGADVYGNTTATTLTLTIDALAPTGGAISYANGGTNASTIAVTLAAVSDTQSGVAGGTRSLQRATAPLSGNSCGTYTAFTEIVANPPVGGSVQNVPLTANQCSQYRYVFTDAVGNSTTSTSMSVVKAKSYTAAITGTSGLVSYYSMSDSGSTVTDSVGGNNGTQNGTTAGPSAITGDTAGASRYYNGSTDYNRVPRNIGGNFSIELWFRTTQSFGSGTQWYNGAGLVDAEVAGAQNDFGISLIGGRVAAGTGNADRSVVTLGTYNDGNWHHVVLTRTQSGSIVLYVDGTQQGTIATNANVLNASANIDFGRLQTGINYYQGNLDDISFYNRALTAAEVTAHYNAGNAS